MISDDNDNWKSYLETPPNFGLDRPPTVFPFGNSFPVDLIYEENEEDYYYDDYFISSPPASNPSSPTATASSSGQMSLNVQPTAVDSLDNLQKIGPISFPSSLGSINTNGEFENRTLLVSNLPNNMISKSDLESIFSSYGDIENIDLTELNKGIAKIRFFDIRSSQWARITDTKINSKSVFKSFAPLEEVTNPRKPPNNGTIVIFHLPVISDDELFNIFSKFGEIRQIRSTPLKQNQKFIEFFDIRNADVALKTMNGQLIKKSRVSIEFSLPGGFRKNGGVPPKNFVVPKVERNKSRNSY